VQEFFESLSLGSASLLVAVVCGLAAAVFTRITPVAIAWTGAVVLSFVVAYCVYWTPVWLGSSDRAQYFAWEFLGVGAPFLTGLVVSLVITFAFRRRAKPHV
jgi:hypothetical protein